LREAASMEDSYLKSMKKARPKGGSVGRMRFIPSA
jgi:hypothetical protein